MAAFCLTYILSAAAVSAEAAKAPVDDLEAAEQQLQEPHAQQDGEQDHVPHHRVFGVVAGRPHSLVSQVTAPADPT